MHIIPSPSTSTQLAAAGTKSAHRQNRVRRLWRQSPQKLTNTTLRRISSKRSFVTTVVQDERSVPTFSYDEPIVMMESLFGNAGRIDSIAVMPLTLNSWLLTGFLNQPHISSGSGAGRIGRNVGSVYGSYDASSDPDSSMHCLSSNASDMDMALPRDVERSSDAAYESSSTSDTSPSDDGRMLSDKKHDEQACSGGCSPWSEWEKERLLEYSVTSSLNR